MGWGEDACAGSNDPLCRMTEPRADVGGALVLSPRDPAARLPRDGEHAPRGLWPEPGASPFEGHGPAVERVELACRDPHSSGYVVRTGELACGCAPGSEGWVVDASGLTQCVGVADDIRTFREQHGGWSPAPERDEPVVGAVPPSTLSHSREITDLHGVTLRCDSFRAWPFMDVHGDARCGCADGLKGLDVNGDGHTTCVGYQVVPRYTPTADLPAGLLAVPALVLGLVLAARRQRTRHRGRVLTMLATAVGLCGGLVAGTLTSWSYQGVSAWIALALPVLYALGLWDKLGVGSPIDPSPTPTPTPTPTLTLQRVAATDSRTWADGSVAVTFLYLSALVVPHSGLVFLPLVFWIRFAILRRARRAAIVVAVEVAGFAFAVVTTSGALRVVALSLLAVLVVDRVLPRRARATRLG